MSTDFDLELKGQVGDIPLAGLVQPVLYRKLRFIAEEFSGL